LYIYILPASNPNTFALIQKAFLADADAAAAALNELERTKHSHTQNMGTSEE